MSEVDYTRFIYNLDNSANKTQSISNWLLQQNNFLINHKNYKQSYDDEDKWDKEESLIEFYNAMFELLKYFVKKEYYPNPSTDKDAESSEDKSFLSYQLQLQYAQVLRNGMVELHHYTPGKIYDLSMIISNIFAEEEIPKITVADDKKKKKKISIKKQYHYSDLKSLCCVCLSFLMESFHKDLVSLFPLILTGLFKNLKKMHEKPKYFIANFSISLIKLFRSIIPNYKVPKEFQTRFLKYFKDISKYPHEFQSIAVECSYIIFINHKSLKNKHLTDELYKAIEVDLYFEISSQSASKLVSDILFYYLNDQKLSLEDCLEFYCKLFVDYSSRKIKSGIFESLVQFLSLNYMKDLQFFSHDNYLHLMKTLSCEIFQNPNFKRQKIDSITRYIQYFHNLHDCLLSHVSESSKVLMLKKIFESSDYLKNDEEHINETLLFLDFTNQLLLDLSESIYTDDLFIKTFTNQLLKFNRSGIFLIRIHSNMVLKTFFRIFPQYLQDTLQNSIDSLSSNFSMIGDFSFPSNHGYAILIANMMEIADKNYVANDLILKITVFVTSFLKKSNASVGAISYYKELLCWIILTGLMSYKDKGFIQLQKNQLFLFWKNLLTHSTNFNSEDELYKNLEIRNHSLTCLQAFLINHKVLLNEELAKQVTYLLTKSSAFNNQIAFKSKAIDNSLLNNEHRILQIYAVIKEYVKKDFSSSMLILVLKNFSDPSLFLSEETNILKEFLDNAEKKNSKDYKEVINLKNLLASEDSFAYGLTSFISLNSIDQIGAEKVDNILNWKKYIYWDVRFEEDIYKPSISVLSYDYMFLLYGTRYSANTPYVPGVISSLINYSMYIFTEVFPYLNTSIQLSVLENLNSFMFSKKSIPERLLSIAFNSSIAIYNSLKIFIKKNLKMDYSIASLLIEMLKKIDIRGNEELMKIIAENIGMISFLMDEDDMNELLDISKKAALNETETITRVFNFSIISSVLKHNSEIKNCGAFIEIFIGSLYDQDPIVHTWALDSLFTIVSSSFSNDVEKFTEILNAVFHVYFSDEYGSHSKNLDVVNYASDFDTHEIICNIVLELTRKASKDIFTDMEKITMQKYATLLVNFTIDTNINTKCTVLEIHEFLLPHRLKFFHYEPIVELGLKVFNNGYYVTNASFNSSIYFSKDIFNWTSSVEAISRAASFFAKLYETENIENREIEYYTMLLLSKYPFTRELILLLKALVNGNWIDKIFNLYNTTQVNLNSFINKNFVEHLSMFNSQTNISSETMPENLTSSKFKSLLLNVLINLINELDHENKVYTEKIIQLALEASNSKVKNLKRLGMEVFDMVVQKSYDLDESQEAEFASILIPAFDKFSSMEIVKLSLKCCSDFISLHQNFGMNSDIAKLMVQGLSEISDKHKDTLRLGGFVAETRNAKSELQLHLLSTWAALKVSKSSMVDTYLPALVPLWIILLRQNAINRHNLENEFKPEPLDSINFTLIQAIGVVAQENFEVLNKILKIEDIQSFMFVLYGECMEYIWYFSDDFKSTNLALITLNQILKCGVLCEIFFENEVHTECVNILEHTVLNSNLNDFIVSEICSSLSEAYISQFTESKFLNNIDKLYELFGIQLKIITKYIPFIEEGVSADKYETLNSSDLSLIKNAYLLIATTCSKMPTEFKEDINSCLLFTMGMIFNNNSNCNYYVPHILPSLKVIILNNADISRKFYMCVKDSVENNFTLENYVTTMSILIINKLEHVEIENFISRFFQILTSSERHEKILASMLEHDYPLKAAVMKSLSQHFFSGLSNKNNNITILTKNFITIVLAYKSQVSIKLGLLFLDEAYLKYPELEMSGYLEALIDNLADQDTVKASLNDLSDEVRERIYNLAKLTV